MIKRIYLWIRFGGVYGITKARINYTPCEVEFRSKRTGKVIGYWAYGSFDPRMPYTG